MKALLVIITLFFSATVCAQEPAPPVAPAPAADNPLLGVWENKTDPTIVLWFQPKKVAWLQGGQLQLGLVKYEADKVHLLIFGKKMLTWFIKVNGDELSLTAVKAPSIWVRSKIGTQNLDVYAAPVGESKPLAAEKVKELQKLIKDRAAQIESMGKDPAMTAAREKLAAETNALLKETIAASGWIDTDRFGRPAADAAFDLVQKCGDVQLMLAVLPLLQKEAIAKKLDGNNVARFFDRVKLSTGQHQRYGTQLGKNDKNELTVLPLEDKAKVDEFRKEMGLSELTKDAKDRDLKFEEGF